MNDLAFAATLFAACALLVSGALVEATSAPRHAVKPSGWSVGSVRVTSVQPGKSCTLVAANAAR